MPAEMPPAGSRTVPSRAKKEQNSMQGKFGSALKEGAIKTKKSSNGFSDSQSKKKIPQYRVAKGAYSNILMTKILKAILVGIAFLFLIYLCFAVTIVRVLPTSSMGLVPVKNITFNGGLIPAGSQVIADMKDKHGSGIVDYLGQSFIPNSNVALVEVEAGPWGSFTWNNGQVVYDEQIVPVIIPNEPEKKTLENSYLVKCIEGACVPGQGYVISSLQILGEPLN